MATGMEMMIKSLVKMLGLDPVKLELTVEEIRKSLSSAAADMATLRRQNTAIMAHLGIPDFIEERTNEQPPVSGQRIAGPGLNGSGQHGAGKTATDHS